jgi:hypothetical protein
MNTYFRSLYYGWAAALVFVGLFGFAIDNEQWRISVWLIIIGVVMARVTYVLRNRE